MMCKPRFQADFTSDSNFGRMNTVQPQNGYSLLLATLITSAVLSAASLLAGVVVSEIRQTQEIASGIAAYVKAEEGIEKAIFMLRNTDLTLAEIEAKLTDVTLEAETRPQYVDIKENDFASFSITPGTPISEVTPRIVKWDLADTACVSWIEVTTVGWDRSAGALEPFNTSRSLYSRASDFVGGVGGGSLTIPFLATGDPVEVRVRALYCDIDQLGVEQIPGRVRIRGIGVEGRAKRSVETLIVRYPPLSGLFDFAVFSECSVVKGENFPSVCP